MGKCYDLLIVTTVIAAFLQVHALHTGNAALQSACMLVWLIATSVVITSIASQTTDRAMRSRYQTCALVMWIITSTFSLHTLIANKNRTPTVSERFVDQRTGDQVHTLPPF